MTLAEDALNVVVSAKANESDGVVTLVLRSADGAPLPGWSPGAHVDVLIEGYRTRQYSLAGDPADTASYLIGVLREADGSGTSRFIHDVLQPGDAVRISAPRNHFVLHPATRYLFIAGGIGITPILPMIAAAEAAGAEWSLAYGGRTRASMGFLGRLARFGARVSLYPQDERGLIDLASLLATARDEMLVYCCGPEPLLQAVERRCAGWPEGALRTERFSAKPLDPGAATGFDVILRGSGVTLRVPPDRSILSVVEDAGIPVYCSCEQGTCGSCETAVIEGVPDHRDSVLSAAQRARNECMMICVSRAMTPTLTLDL